MTKDKPMKNLKLMSALSWKPTLTHVKHQKSPKPVLKILVIQMSIFLSSIFLTAAQPDGKIFINAVVNQLLQVNQLRARNMIVSGDLFVEGSIINGSSSTSGGGSGSGIQTIDGDTGSVTGSTVTIEGGNSSVTNITTSGSGSTLTVSVSGTTENAVQVGSASGSLSSLALGTMGQVLTSNGSSSAPSFEDAVVGIQTIDTAGGGTAMGPTVTFEPNMTTNGQGTPVFLPPIPLQSFYNLALKITLALVLKFYKTLLEGETPLLVQILARSLLVDQETLLSALLLWTAL